MTPLAEAGVGRGTPLALAVVPGHGVALAWPGGTRRVPTETPAGLVAEVDAALAPRWVWWSSRETALPLVQHGVRPATCWDVGAVGRLAYGLRRDDPAAVWAASQGLPEPEVARGALSLLDLDGDASGPLRADGHLSREWLRAGWATDLATAEQWATLALRVRDAQETVLRGLHDPRPAPGGPTLALLTAWAESAAALLAVELEHDGLPVDTAVAGDLLRASIGERPADAAAEAAARRARDETVLRHFPGEPVDLRNPAHVKTLLARVGLDLPDTRSWRLEPYADSSPAVAALLAWRKAERLATTYGWGWLDAHVGADGRLRGVWGASDGASGRMTAQAGLHSLPADLRPAVRARPGWVIVRADLGQVEPRVLAAVSGDPALAHAATEDDMYTPVATHLGCDRPTAKVAVLAAMYGQTSGAAGAALREMERAYPTAMTYLHHAEQAGRDGHRLRTYGGRLLRPGPTDGPDGTPPTPEARHGQGRYARNAVVQGAAAELFKAWAATVRAGLRGTDGQVVLCLHDELLVHAPESQAPHVADLLRSALDSTARWWGAGHAVRFVAEVESGPSWAETTPCEVTRPAR